MSRATANPPATPPPDSCLFPIGVGSCPFQGPTSQGCGVPIMFTTSSGEGDAGAGCLSPPCTNTAAWVSLDPASSPNAGYLRNAINAAASGECGASGLQTGENLDTNNGMVQSVMDTVEARFLEKWAESEVHTVMNTADPPQVVYQGKGWKVFIPVIQTACPAGAISGEHQIVGWTELVMTQVINKGNCAVANHWQGNQWDPFGQPTNCVGDQAPSNPNAMRALFGYFSCTLMPANPVPTPTPRSALADKLRLVR